GAYHHNFVTHRSGSTNSVCVPSSAAPRRCSGMPSRTDGPRLDGPEFQHFPIDRLRSKGAACKRNGARAVGADDFVSTVHVRSALAVAGGIAALPTRSRHGNGGDREECPSLTYGAVADGASRPTP